MCFSELSRADRRCSAEADGCVAAKGQKTRGLVKELKTQYIEGNVDVARPVVLYNCMSTASTLKTSLSTIIPAQGHQNTGVRHQDP